MYLLNQSSYFQKNPTTGTNNLKENLKNFNEENILTISQNINGYISGLQYSEKIFDQPPQDSTNENYKLVFQNNLFLKEYNPFFCNRYLPKISSTTKIPTELRNITNEFNLTPTLDKKSIISHAFDDFMSCNKDTDYEVNQVIENTMITKAKEIHDIKTKFLHFLLTKKDGNEDVEKLIYMTLNTPITNVYMSPDCFINHSIFYDMENKQKLRDGPLLLPMSQDPILQICSMCFETDKIWTNEVFLCEKHFEYYYHKTLLIHPSFMGPKVEEDEFNKRFHLSMWKDDDKLKAWVETLSTLWNKVKTEFPKDSDICIVRNGIPIPLCSLVDDLQQINTIDVQIMNAYFHLLQERNIRLLTRSCHFCKLNQLDIKIWMRPNIFCVAPSEVEHIFHPPTTTAAAAPGTTTAEAPLCYPDITQTYCINEIIAPLLYHDPFITGTDENQHCVLIYYIKKVNLLYIFTFNKAEKYIENIRNLAVHLVNKIYNDISLNTISIKVEKIEICQQINDFHNKYQYVLAMLFANLLSDNLMNTFTETYNSKIGQSMLTSKLQHFYKECIKNIIAGFIPY